MRSWLRTTYRFSALSSHTIPLNRLRKIAVYIHSLTKVTSPKLCGSATLHSPLILCRPVIDRCPVFGILTLNPSSLVICFPRSGFRGFSCLMHGFPLSAREVLYAWILTIWETEDGRIRRYFFYLLLHPISNPHYEFCGFRVSVTYYAVYTLT